MAHELKKLVAKRTELEGEINSIEEKRKTLSGPEKARATQHITGIKEAIVKLDKDISTLTESGKEEKPKSKVETVTVMNVCPYLHTEPSNKARFNPNSEVTTERTGWVQSQIDAGLFKEIDK